jgi:hypothetical protein
MNKETCHQASQSEADGTLACPRIGEPFNPWRKACGFYPPDVVARQRGITDGQKRLYERAVRWAGQQGIFWYGFGSMAEALGKSVRQVKSDMDVLERMGLIRHIRRRRQSNVYEFLWHEMFEVQHTALQQKNLEVQDSALEVQDDVILEVQSTARESSQLESSPLNHVKADYKRIPGCAPQKQRSAASSSAICTDEIKRRSSKADQPGVMRQGEGGSHSWTKDQLAEVRHRIVAYWGREPEQGFEVSVMLRARGAIAAEVCSLLDRKFANRNLRVGGRYAPKSQNWFLTVIENEFMPGHLPECPSALSPPPQESERETLDRGIETIELAHAPRSIVESVICNRCGRAGLVLYTDGSIDSCGCDQKNPFGLRTPALTYRRTNAASH